VVQRLRLRGWRHCVPAALSIAGAVLAGGVWLTSPAQAEVQVGQPPCISMPDLAVLREDPRLALPQPSISSTRHVPDGRTEAFDLPRLEWGQAEDAERLECISVKVQRPGGEYSAFVEFILPPTERSLVPQVAGAPGRFCFLLIPLAADARGPETELCVDLARPWQPVGPVTQPPVAPGPPTVGTGLRSGLDFTWTLAILGAGLLAAIALIFGPALVRLRRQRRP
jgi:hypothetical protein